MTKFLVSVRTEDQKDGIDGEFEAPTAEAAVAKARAFWNASPEAFPVEEVTAA